MISGSAIKYSITGDKELDRLLKRLPEKIQSRLLAGALKKAAKRTFDYMYAEVLGIMANAVGADYEKTGNLLSSLGITLRRKSKTDKTYRIVAVGPRGGEQFTVWLAGGKVRAGQYAAALEYGWIRRAGNYPANPFLSRSYAKAAPTVASDFKAAIGKGIEREAKKKR